MLFNSLDYLIFLPIVVVLYFMTTHKYRWIILLAASYYFYMSWNPGYIILIVFSTLLDYFAARGIAGSTNSLKRKILLALSLTFNLSLLLFFKYFNFFGTELNDFSSSLGYDTRIILHQFLLPVGISFYTFQTMSYTIDVYNGKAMREKHLGVFAVYVSYFPQLVAGPIERANHLLGQLKEEQQVYLRNFQFGLIRILWGLFKKVVIADRLAEMVNVVYNSPQDYAGFQLIFATVLFAFQIYCDFSGYSDIAIGTSRLFGIRLMENFRTPYFSSSISEFWRRWHISLSTWFRDYVYIPLGGNRVVKWRRLNNLFITFFISGLWHGANWTFLIWGALHGIVLILEMLIKPYRIPIPAILKIIFTFSMVCLAWIFFRANHLQDAFYIINHLFDFSSPFVSNIRGMELYLGQPLWKFLSSILLIIFLLFTEYLITKNYFNELKIIKMRFTIRWGIYAALILSILIFGVFEVNQFIYFQF